MKLGFVLGWLGWAVMLEAAAGQATPYVPALDPTYADVDALQAAGLMPDALLGERPLSRLMVARLAVEARTRAQPDGVLDRSPRLVEALARLERDFAPEIAALCVDPSACAPLPRGAVLRALGADATVADSRSRPIPTSYDWSSADYIDADLNPLLQRNQGRVLADGETIAAEGWADFGFGPRVAAQLRPRVWALDDRVRGSAADATLLEGNVRALFGNLAVEVGRNHLALGHGHESGPVLSNNARGLDMVRLSLDRPARLPWKLAALGQLTATALIADMGGNSDTPHSKLIVFDGVLRPSPLVEIQATLLNHQGGENSPSATIVERLRDIFLISPQGAPISDKVVAAGVAVSVPRLRTRVYSDVMTTDDHDLFLAETGQALSTEAVWIVGARTTGLGSARRFDAWAEGRKAGVRPHTHHQFTSGLTLDRQVIGDALGPLGESISGGVDWTGAQHLLTLELALERYSNADFYVQLPGDGQFAWIRTVDKPDERRARVTADWRALPAAGRFVPGVRLGVERVVQWEFKPVIRSNALVQVRLEYRPR